MLSEERIRSSDNEEREEIVFEKALECPQHIEVLPVQVEWGVQKKNK